MKNVVSVTGKCILLLVIGGIVGTFLLTMVFFISVNEEKAAASLESRYVEGEYPSANELSNHGDAYFVSFLPAVLDDVTDDLMLKNAFIKKENPFISAIDMNHYPRYWHGYVLILRPLLYFMEYRDFRILNCLLQILLVSLAVISIWKQMEQKRYVLAFLTSYVLLMPLALFFSLQYSWVFYIAFGGILFVVNKKDALLRNMNYIFFFWIMGMLTTFFDLLTYPLVTWGFPLVWWVATCGNSMNGKERLKKVIFSGISWIGGYGGFWLLKWIIATPVLGYNVIEEAMGEVLYRVNEVDEYAKGLLQAYEKWEVLYSNWRHYEYGIYAIILTAWILWAVFHSVRAGWRVRPESGAYLLITCSSVVWYLVLSNHTTIHHFFTYRIYGVSIAAFLCFLLECVRTEKPPHRRPWKECVMTLFAWGLFAAAGYGLAMAEREDIMAIYGGEYQEVLLKEEEVLETTFIPTFSNIKNIGFCLRSSDGTGYYNVTVLQNEEILYQLEQPLSHHTENYYHTEEVDWDLRAGQEYRIQIELYESSGDNFVFITEDGNMPLNEYQNLRVNGTELDGQPLGGLRYHARVQSRLRRGYAALMWMALLGAVSALLLKIKKMVLQSI